MTTTQKQDKTTVPDWLPAEALEAIRTGGDWDGMPDSAGDEPTWYFQDDDEWESMWHPTGYVVEGGKLFFRVMDVDSDGNWEFNDEAEAGTPEEGDLQAQYGYEEWEKSYHEYLTWVAENGEDPVGEFFVKPTIKVEQKWRAHFRNAKSGVELVRAKREGHEWKNPVMLPARIKEFLGLEDARTYWRTRDFATLADLEKTIAESPNLKKHRVTGKGIAVSFTLDVERPNPRYRALLVQAAQNALKPVKGVKK